MGGLPNSPRFRLRENSTYEHTGFSGGLPLKQHIPEKFFRMVRYFGFLSNRVCGEKLPQVYRALGMKKPEAAPKVCYAQMSKPFLRRDPFECILCGGHMVYRRAISGLNVGELKIHAREISLMRYIPA